MFIFIYVCVPLRNLTISQPCIWISILYFDADPQLSKSNTEDWELKSIEQTMIDLHHFNSTNSVISILKIDTEGSEWDALSAFFSR